MLTLDDIKAQPLTPARVALLKASRAGTPFTAAARDELLAGLALQAPDANIRHFLATLPAQTLDTRLLATANLMDEVAELGLAAQILFLRGQDPNAQLGSKPLWRSIVDSSEMIAERTQHVLRIASIINDGDVRFRWGTPDSWFFYQPGAQLINIDLWHGFVFGLYRTRSLIQHEIGHAEITKCFTPEMMQIHAEMEKMDAAAASGARLSPADYKRKCRLFNEWNYRATFTNAAEDNAVNRLAAKRGENALIDYGDCLNVVEGLMIEAGIACGLDAHSRVSNVDPSKPALPALAKNASQQAAAAYDSFQALCGGTNFAFFCRNGLYENTAAGWQSVQINPDRLPLAPSGGEDRFERIGRYLDELDATVPTAVSRMQPMFVGFLQRWMPHNNPRALAQRRMTSIDRLYDTYAAPLVNQMLDFMESKLDEQMQQQQQSQQQQKSQQQGQKGQSKDQQGGKGQDQDKDQQGQPGQAGNQQQGQSPGQQGTPQEQEPDSNGGGAGAPDPTAEPQPGAAQPGDQAGQSQPGQGQPGQGQDPQGAQGQPGNAQDQGAGQGPGVPDPAAQSKPGAVGQPAADSGMVEVEGVGPMPDPGKTAAAPDSQAKPDPAAVEAAQQAEAEGDPTLQEILDQYREAQQGEASQAAAAQQNAGARLSQAKQTHKVDLSHLPPGDWSSYAQRVQERADYIADMVDQLRAIRDLQREELIRQRAQLQILPEDSDIAGRMDIGAHIGLRTKQVIGEDLTEDDFRRFQEDNPEEVVSYPILAILIDGSGSMNQASPGGGRLLDQALNAGVIIYEACRELEFPCYLGVWGPSNPVILARPGDDPVEIGQNIEKFSNGMNSYTNLAPAFIKLAKNLVQLPDDVRFSGYLHVAIMSDGDIQDAPDAEKIINLFFERIPLTTIDCGILTGVKGTAMETMMDRLHKPDTDIEPVAVHHDFLAPQLADRIAQSLLERLGSNGSLAAAPDYDAHRRFKNLGEDLKL